MKDTGNDTVHVIGMHRKFNATIMDSEVRDLTGGGTARILEQGQDYHGRWLSLQWLSGFKSVMRRVAGGQWWNYSADKLATGTCMAFRSPGVAISRHGGFALYNVCKNGSSTLRRAILEAADQEKSKDKCAIQKLVPARAAAAAIADLDRVLVWRDPVDRFLSMLNYGRSMNLIGHPFLDGLPRLNPEIAARRLLAMCHMVSKSSDPFLADQHLMSQRRNIHGIPLDDVDILIDLGDLDAFIMERFGAVPKPMKAARNMAAPCSKSVFAEGMEDQIKEIFADDYEMYLKLSDRLYVPVKTGR